MCVACPPGRMPTFSWATCDGSSFLNGSAAPTTARAWFKELELLSSVSISSATLNLVKLHPGEYERLKKSLVTRGEGKVASGRGTSYSKEGRKS